MKPQWAILMWACTAACIALVGIWYWSGTRGRFFAINARVELAVTQGIFGVFVSDRANERASAVIGVSPADPSHAVWGWGFARGRMTGPTRGLPLAIDYWMIPMWSIEAGLLVPTVLLWRSCFRARRAARTNLCPTCGYPLTGLTPGSPCPECGKPPAS